MVSLIQMKKELKNKFLPWSKDFQEITIFLHKSNKDLGELVISREDLLLSVKILMKKFKKTRAQEEH